ncbi:MAG: hypothetical protein LLG16_05325 [Euryarchaeota archaeon]|nr:hypothetical protein [Euryarchaeota archaeon]
MARPVYIEHATVFDGAVTAMGGVMLALGVIDFTNPEIFDIGGWGYYLLAAGFILLLAGVLLIYAYAKRVRSFAKMMTVKSKKEFAGIRDELEYTAWRLPSRYDAKVAEKKKEFDLK